MVPLVHLLLLTRVKIVYPDPRIVRGSNNEAVSEERVKGCGSGRMRERDGDWWVLAAAYIRTSVMNGKSRRRLPKDVEEMDFGPRGDAQRSSTMCQLHRRYSFAKVKRGGLSESAQVPPTTEVQHRSGVW